jgi:hypothetical protein
MNSFENLYLQQRGTSFGANTGVRLRKRVTNSRAGSEFVGDQVSNGTRLQYRGHQKVAADGAVWLFVGCHGLVDGWVRKEHTVVVMVVHRAGNADYCDLRHNPTRPKTNFQGRVADGTRVEVTDQVRSEGLNWAYVREPTTGVHGWIKVEHLQSAGHQVRHVPTAHHHAVGGGAHHRAVGGGGAQHHAVGGGGACPLTQQLHQAAIRAAQHQQHHGVSQLDIALAQQQMHGFRQQQAQAQAHMHAQAQMQVFHGLQFLGALGL